MKKRLVSLLLTGIMVMSLAVGCSGVGQAGAGDSEGSGGEEVTLRWMQFQVEYAEQVKNMLVSRAGFKDVIVLDTAGISSMYASDGGIIVVV